MRARLRVAAALAATLILGACAGGEASIDDQGSYFAPTAAVVCGAVNCQKIAESRVNQPLRSAMEDPDTAKVFRGPQGDANRLDAQRRILSDLIVREIGLQEARLMNITVDESEVDDQLERVKDSFPNAEAYREALKTEGVTEAQLRGQLANDSVLTRVRDVVSRNAGASPAEVEQFFELNKSQFDEQVKVAHIVVCGNFREVERRCDATPADQQLAQDLANRARDGEDFGALAREYSVDEFSRESGGELEFFARGDVIPELEELAFSMFQVGDISDPVQTQFGFHVLKLLAVGKTFEEARDEIAESLANQKANAAFEEWLIDAVREAQVKVNPKLGIFDEVTQSVIAKRSAEAQGSGSDSPA